MRQLNKGEIPEILTMNAHLWSSEYIDAVNTGASPVPARWRHPQIVAALREETHAKCAYCEGVISDVSYPHVEHIRAKSARPDLVVEWSNLTLGCTVCNTKKSDYYDEDAPLVHPYEDTPDRHLKFSGPAIFGALNDAKGERTVERLELMRTSLFMERLKRLQSLHALLQRWSGSEGRDKEMRAAVVEAALASDQEFSTCLRAHAERFGFPVEAI